MAGVAPVSPKRQFVDAIGRPLAGGYVDVYLAGTTTRTNTWQDRGMTALNENPIHLDARGECVMWLDPTLTYKLVLRNSALVTQYTVDNVVGAAGGVIDTTLRPDLAATGGAAMLGFQQAGAGAVPRTAEDKMRDVVDVMDFLTAAERTDVKARTGLYNITTKMATALAATPVGGTLKLSAGLFLGYLLVRRSDISIVGDGSASTEIKIPAGALHTITVDGGPSTATGVPCVMDVGHIGNGNYATAYENIHLEGLTLNGNAANTAAPTTDLFGWGLSFTKASHVTYSDIVAKDCHAGGVGTFINSNYHIGTARAKNCGHTLGHPGFDVNSSKYSHWKFTSVDCSYGGRVLDNCWGNTVVGSVHNASNTGFVYNNQTVNVSYGNNITVTVYGGCAGGQGVAVGSKCYGSQVKATIVGVAGIGFYDYVASDALKPRGNTYTINTHGCGGSSSYVGGYRNTYNIVSRLDGQTGAAGTHFAVEVKGKHNTLNVTVEDAEPTSQVRGLVIRAGAEGNSIVDYKHNVTVQDYLLSDTSGTTVYPTQYATGLGYAWQVLTLNGGWSATYGTPYAAPAYLRGNDGFVYLKGTISGGTGVAFTLPVGCRPATETYLFPTAADGATGRLSVNAAGEVELLSGTATAVDLSPVRFPVF